MVLGNAVAERRWSRDAFRTLGLVDKRGQDVARPGTARDFALTLGAAEVGSELFSATSVAVADVGGGLRVTFTLGDPVAVIRTVEMYGGIAGFRDTTTVTPVAPLALRGAVLETVGASGATTIGDPHAGTWRSTVSGPTVDGAGQWLSLAPGRRTAFLVAERNDLPSSRATNDGTTGALVVDWSRDVVSLGPLEENGHAENPTAAPARQRVLAPGVPFALDAAFLGLGTDANRISTGAKDDMDYATVVATADIAKRLGVETFVLDDGWQAISGDWFPDSPQHPEPRWDGTATSKFAPRLPDATFAAVREAIAPMRLGLWMSPMHFHPESATLQAHPEWACAPAGLGTAAATVTDAESSSNEAGIGTWGPLAIPHVESRIREAITAWGVEYFKFDFLVWLDCAGQGTMHDYQDAFVALLDFPRVTFQVDETNDYRLFPYASVPRGPSWFQNGTPAPARLLHSLWNLAPFVPTESSGQHFLGGRQWTQYPVSTPMAGALLSHATYFSDLRDLPDAVVAEAAE